MVFGFPESKIDKKLFKRNFLRNVIFQIKFENNINIIEKSDEIHKIFKADFPHKSENTVKSISFKISNDNSTPIVKNDSLESGYSLKSINSHKTIDLNKNEITLNILGNSYNNFNDIIKYQISLLKVLKKCKINFIDRLAIRKINIIDFKSPDNIDLFDLERFVFNESLISNISYMPNGNILKQNLQNLRYKNLETYLNLRYGILVDKLQQIIIDIDLYKLDKLDIKNIKNESSRINEEIFDIFCWSLNQNSFNQLMRDE